MTSRIYLKNKNNIFLLVQFIILTIYKITEIFTLFLLYFHTTSTLYIKLDKMTKGLTGLASHNSNSFPHKSSRGSSYIFLMYDYDSNTILIEPLETQQAKEITQAYKKCFKKLNNNINKPKLYILDNECSDNLKLAVIKKNAKHELVPPNQHRRNAAEKVICTFKNHFLSGFATYKDDFPIHELD